MILYNSEGEVIFASCRYLSSCASELEVELTACQEGISLTLEWRTLPSILETDCTIAWSMLKGVVEAKHMLGLGRPHEITHVRRCLNCVSHALAQLGRQPRKAVWLRHAHEHILALCKLDCNAPG
ncbi:hypothetical protein VPH35_108370 [Triticum aestivum]